MSPPKRAAAAAADAAAVSPPPGAAPAASKAAQRTGPRILKKYPNRRLYDTETSAYITLADVKRMVLDGCAFEVRDAKSGEDLTRAILLQIILEEESGGVPMFTTPMLSQIIRFYGHAMQGFMGSYLEKNIQAFVEMQSRLAEQATKGLVQPAPFGADAWAQLMNMGNVFEQSRQLFQQMQEQMSTMPGFPVVPPKK